MNPGLLGHWQTLYPLVQCPCNGPKIHEKETGETEDQRRMKTIQTISLLKSEYLDESGRPEGTYCHSNFNKKKKHQLKCCEKLIGSEIIIITIILAVHPPQTENQT